MQLKLYKSVLVIFSDDVIAQAISHSQAHSVDGKGVINNNVFAARTLSESKKLKLDFA